MKQATGKANSTEKALEILLSFTPHNQEMGTVEISQKLGFHKATVSRILHTLTDYGFLQQDAKTRKFRLGQSAINLGLAVNRSIDSEMVLLSKPHIDALRDALNETVVLELVSGRSAVIAYIAEGSGPIRIKGTVGDRRPVHAAAGAKAILAFSPPEMKEQLLKEEMKQLTPNTITNVRVLLDQLEEIRRQGFAFDNEEVNLGINAMGAPIFNHEGRPVAAVVVAGLSQGITWEGASPIVSQLRHTAARISSELYYKGEYSHADEGRENR
jgi:IclR family acetate operon transcriptional repressor